MSWFSSIVIGVLTAVLGCVGAGVVASFCVRWYRISSFEGGAGYFVVLIAFFGAVAGLVGGIVASRFVPGGEREFLRGLGVALGCMSALLVAVALVCRVAADVAPEISGQAVELAIEVRCPEGFARPATNGEPPAFAAVFLPHGRHQPRGEWKWEQATQSDGRWIVPADVPLDTSIGRKFLRVYFSREHDALFALPLRSHPDQRDFGWSPWLPGGWNANEPEPAPSQRFEMRYRVRIVVPPPPGPTQEELDARETAKEQAAFAALPEDAPVGTWLPYTRYGSREDQLRVAVARIVARPDHATELAPLMLSSDQETAADALRVIEHFPAPTPALIPPVTRAAEDLIARLQRTNATPAQEDPSYLGAADVSVRFNAWLTAARTLREKAGADFTPELAQILELSRIRTDSHVLQMDVRRVAGFYLNEWAGVPPLAGDPKPR